MIEIHNLSKLYPLAGGYRTVLDNLNFTISPGEKIGILGRNGAGKSTLIRILSGAEQPTSGSVKRSMSLSWPLAFGGAFQGSLTGLDNLKFICRIYGMPYQDKIAYVQEFTELGKYSAGAGQDLFIRYAGALGFCYFDGGRVRLFPDR